ncbi:GntR family transcriptional regulator [Glutamicibacter sp. BW80]|uniref:GntR family transcriptional regulator n=1 Tax=Glutamicibacter sp. BW80 TaxID=2024404 RepID=UPI001C3ED060|nr:GntR family transcriptional regulator [Glutamicibacter sp. BW80]
MMTSDWRSNVSLARETAGVISERVFSGRYLPGQVLAQSKLSQELGLSRTPLREALSLLEREGIICIDAAGRAMVRMMAGSQLLEALVFREALESAACKLLCGQLPETVLDELQRLIQQARTGDQRSMSRFHLVLLDASNNSYLQSFSGLVRMTEEVILPGHGRRGQALQNSLIDLTELVLALREGASGKALQHLSEYFDKQLALLDNPERHSL